MAKVIPYDVGRLAGGLQFGAYAEKLERVLLFEVYLLHVKTDLCEIVDDEISHLNAFKSYEGSAWSRVLFFALVFLWNFIAVLFFVFVDLPDDLLD